MNFGRNADAATEIIPSLHGLLLIKPLRTRATAITKLFTLIPPLINNFQFNLPFRRFHLVPLSLLNTP